MTPALRRFALTAHIASSVGWLGAVAAFLALAILASTSDDPQTVRAVYLVLEPAAWFVLVPLALASLLTGVVQSLGTSWGLFRHYWVLFKLGINLFATAILLMYMGTLSELARIAADPAPAHKLSAPPGVSVALHAGAALILLLVATALAVYKPRGMTRYGQRKLHEQRMRRRHAGTSGR